ncbi:M56 family metallopeptidase [Maribellus mangrovi]|uniref:M56 family metallopeptidase n=1 Tax=Maribellus mangrovi TaxID=3133146 RepID=UPI0030EC6A31
MNPFFVWLIKSSVSLALLFALFKITVSNDKMHKSNRFVLLGIMALSVLLPLLNFQLFYEDIQVKPVAIFREIVSTPVFTDSVGVEAVQQQIEPVHVLVNPWHVVYGLAILALLIRLIASIVQAAKMVRRAEKQRLQKIVLAVVKDLIQPFTFLNKIVLSEKDYVENKEIVVAHEYAHIKQLHGIDLLICELFTVLHFFNPFMWLLRRDLKLIHEYQADEAVLNKGIDAQEYQLLVLEKAVGERRFAMANYFTQHPIKKRLKMMTKSKHRRWAGVKLILFVPLIAMLLQAFARPEILVEKAGELLPAINQQDDSKAWIDSWVNNSMQLITDESFLNTASNNKTKHVVSIVDSDVSVSEEGTFTKSNVFIILQNSKGELLVEDERLQLKDLKPNVEAFLRGKNTLTGEVPDFKLVDLPHVGKAKISEGVILYRMDVATPQNSTRAVLTDIAEAVLKVRNDVAHEKFGEDYFSLSSNEQDVVDKLVPDNISFASPKRMKVKPPPPPPPEAVELKVAKDGSIYVGNFYKAPKAKGGKWQLIENKKVTKEKLRNYLTERNSMAAEMTKQYNRKYEQRVNVAIEVGATDKQVNELKELLRSLKIQHINYTSEQIIPKSESGTGGVEYFKSSYVKINDATYQLQSAILGNESSNENGKFELDLFSDQFDKKIALYFLSLKSTTKEEVEKGSYIYSSNGFNSRGNNTFWGKVAIQGKEYDITRGTVEIEDNSTNRIKANFNIVLSDGTKMSGRYNNTVTYKDWRKSTASN